MLIIWTLFSNAATLRDNFMSPESQEKWKTLPLLPRLHWWIWAIGVIAILFLLAIEGGYRAVKRREAEIQKLRAQYTPRLEGEIAQVFHWGADSKWYCRINMTIRNLGESTAIAIGKRVLSGSMPALRLT